jgi:uncharacterized protein with ATP-grasp and redox domains
MLSDYRCFYCLTRAFEKLLEKENISRDAKRSFTRDMIRIYQDNWDKFNAPEFAQVIHTVFKNYTGNPDPYKKVKKENNKLVISLYPELKKLVNWSKDSFKSALKLAIAGNIMDFAAGDNFNLHSTIEKALKSEFAIDHSEKLKERLGKARKVLYLGDNAGEIVLDKLFIETINHHCITFVVRGTPVINDATMEDAEFVGMKKIANVISNGYDAPSTILGKSGSEFRKYFREADLIISKGQGNLEGLISLGDERIFFLLMVKCNVIAEMLKIKKDSLIVLNTTV